MNDRWIDAHSVTCAICGGLADETETVSWSSMDEPVIPPEASRSTEMTIRELLERVGNGEAHLECFEYAEEHGVPSALDERGVDDE